MVTTTQKILAGFKKTEVGVIPADWDVKRLDDIFSISAGRDLIKDSYSKINDDTHSIPIYSNSLENKGLYGYTKIARHRENCITITARGTIGRANARNHKFDAIGRLLVMEPIKDLDCFFISEYLNNRVQFSIESTGVPQLTAPQASKYLVSYPEPKEQHAIASVFSDIDMLISELEKFIVKKRNIKQGAMQELLIGKRRLPGFSGKWEAKKLGDICDYQNGTSLERYFNNEDGLKVISIGNYSSEGKFVITNTYIDRGLENSVKKFILNKNELTMILNDKTPAGNIIGRVLLIEEDNAYVFNQRTMRLKPKQNILPKFLYYKINSDETHNRILSAAKPGTQIYVNTNDVIDFKVAIPKNIEEQTAIAKVLSEMDSETEALEQKLNKYKMLKQGMMQVLLTGKIRLI